MKNRFDESVKPSPSGDAELKAAKSILKDMGYRYTGTLEDIDNLHCFENDNAQEGYQHVLVSIATTPGKTSFLLHSAERDTTEFGEISLSQFIKQRSFSHAYKRGNTPKP